MKRLRKVDCSQQKGNVKCVFFRVDVCMQTILSCKKIYVSDGRRNPVPEMNEKTEKVDVSARKHLGQQNNKFPEVFAGGVQCSQRSFSPPLHT